MATTLRLLDTWVLSFACLDDFLFWVLMASGLEEKLEILGVWSEMADLGVKRGRIWASRSLFFRRLECPILDGT